MEGPVMDDVAVMKGKGGEVLKLTLYRTQVSNT